MDGYVDPSNGKISNVDCSRNDFPNGDSFNHKPMEALMEQTPKMEFFTGQGRIVTLLYDSPKSGENNYGTWYRYAVNSGGQEQCIFASTGLHEQLVTYKKGDTVEILKEEFEPGRTRFNVIPQEGTLPNQPKPSSSNDTDLKIQLGMAFNNTTRLVCSMPFHADETPEDRIKLIAELYLETLYTRPRLHSSAYMQNNLLQDYCLET